MCYNNIVMKISEINNNLVLTNVKDFNLENIFDCGQCFRWNKQEDGAYIGVANSRALKISQENDIVTLYETSIEDFNNIWFKYFDFATNYQEIKQILSSDLVLKSATEFGDGIRILNQELWECVVSFIISASNNIPRIKKIVSALCELCGEKVDGCNMKAFPTAQAVYSLGIDGLAPIKSGFRAKYIISAAESVVNGETDFDSLRKSDYETAKKQLMKIKGVGPKVADCALLFGLGFTEAFPVDVWIKRVVSKYYGESFTPEYFGKYAGIAQQFLFYNERYV